jgi:putative ABC transport system permease protein
VNALWQVHLSPEAATALRDASRSAAATIGAGLDDLSRRGPAAVELVDDGTEWTGNLIAGDYLVTAAGRESDQRIIVVRIALLDEHGAHRAVDVLPLKLSTRRTLGGVLQGLDLDLRYTFRALSRARLFTAVVIATLAIGFGGATALLDIVHTVYGSALPFGDGDRLVRLRNANVSPNGEIRRYNLTPSDFDMLRTRNRSFSEVVAMGGRSISLVGDGPAERVSAVGVSANWSQTLRLSPVVGRTFTPEEERAGTDAGVGLISYALWQRRFGGDSAVVGQALRYDGGAITIIGVMPANINYPYDAAVWMPWTFHVTNTTASSLNVVARLADAATLESARTDAERVHAERQAANLHRSATSFDVATVRSDFIRDDARTIQALSFAVLFLLVLACANVANLLVARFTTRRAELGLRAALGGRRDQQIRQMLLESFVLFATGAAGGMLLGNWLRRFLAVTIPDDFRTELGFVETNVGSGVAALTLVVGLTCGLAVGIIAALRAARTDPMMLVRQGGRATIGRGDRRMFDVLVASQLSFSLVLLVGASVLIGRFRELSSTHPGYELADVATMRLTIEQDRYSDGDARNRLVSTIEDRLAAVPGVSAVGITTVNPLCCGDWGAPIEIEGRPVSPNEPATLVAHSYVSPGYFDAMTIRLRRGTGFDRADRPNGPQTVVIDEEFAKMAWPGQDAMGKRVRLARPDQPWRTVIGIAPVTEHEAEMRAAWFLPYYQNPTGPSTEQLHVMVRRSPAVSLESLRGVIAEIDPALAVYAMTTMEALQDERTSQDRLGAIVSGVFAVFGLVLAAFSLYGLLSYSVELRRGEMGIRMALGASRGSIVSLVFRQAVTRLAAGITLGLALAIGVNQLLRGTIEGLDWVPWQTLLTLTVLMTVVTAAAALAPAVRATRVDPIRSLRG